jgi:hypothetical protein
MCRGFGSIELLNFYCKVQAVGQIMYPIHHYYRPLIHTVHMTINH